MGTIQYSVLWFGTYTDLMPRRATIREITDLCAQKGVMAEAISLSGPVQVLLVDRFGKTYEQKCRGRT